MEAEILLKEVKAQKQELGEIALAKLILDFISGLEKESPDLEKESSALLIFSELLFLKSRRLLPAVTVETMSEEAQEGEAAELVESFLKEYPVFKQAADKLSELWESSRSSFPRAFFDRKEEIIFLEVSTSDLVLAFSQVMERRTQRETCLVIKKPVIVFSQFLSLVWRIILKDKVLKFSDLKERFADKPRLIAAFLALLELAKRRKVRLLQESLESELVIEKR